MTAPLDASTLTSWEDAFAYPIPQVRQLERQLRTDLAANKTQLRGLVGESYRDLLQTAERIITMDQAAAQVEASLGALSRECKSAVLDRKRLNLRSFQEKRGRDRDADHAHAAQLRVLLGCPGVVARLLQRGARDGGGAECLLAAKIFVVGRLLLKSVLETGTSPLVDSLKAQLATLRTGLLQHIDEVLSTAAEEQPDTLVTALTAFSIMKTSSPAEALRQFLFVRSTAIATRLNAPTADSVCSSVGLFNQTLADTYALFPQRLSAALVALKSRSLLQDSDVVAVPELELDVLVRWLPADIRGYIPWVRHDDLERTKAAEAVSAWAGREITTIHAALESALSGIDNVAAVVSLRANLLQLWRVGRKPRSRYAIPSTADSLASNTGGADDRFRELISLRLAALAKAQADGLDTVGDKIQALLEARDTRADSTSIWDDALLSIPLSNGALAFRKAVQARVHGRNGSVEKFLRVHSAWLDGIEKSAIVLRELRSSEAPATGDEEEEDFEVEETRVAEDLEDSETAERELVAALDGVFRHLEMRLGKLVEACTASEDASRKGTADATFLLRCIRQIRLLPPKREETTLLPLSWFGVHLLPKLHTAVSRGVVSRALDRFEAGLKRREWQKQVLGKVLWEGTPPLPTSPSPLVFQTLDKLAKDMEGAGEDVWTPAAANCVKAAVVEGAWAALEKVLTGREVVKESKVGQDVPVGGDSVVEAKAKARAEAKEQVNAAEMTVANADDMAAAEEEMSKMQEPEDPPQEPPPANAQVGDGESAEAGKKEISTDTTTRGANGTHESPAEPDSTSGQPEQPQPQPTPPPPQLIMSDWTLQLLFDALYLDEALNVRGKKTASAPTFTLAGRVDALLKLDFDESLRSRLEGGASEYWRRTGLLFSWLA